MNSTPNHQPIKAQLSSLKISHLIRWRMKNWTIFSGWAVMLFYVFIVGILSLFLSSAMLLRSPEGVQKGLDLLKAQGKLSSLLVETGEKPSSSSAPSDTQAQAALEQAKQVSKLISPDPIPLSAWLLTMQNHRMVSSPMTVYLRPYHVSPRQDLVAKVQGINFVPWNEGNFPPQEIDHVSRTIEIWVERSSSSERGWIIKGSMSDLLQSNSYDGNTITNLDVLKMILWADEFQKQDEWMALHPTPVPPDDVQPSPVSVSIIPSTAGLLMAFWIGVGFITIFVASGCLLMGLTRWSSMVQRGEWEAIASLPLPTWAIPSQFVLGGLSHVIPIIFISCLLSIVFLTILGVPLFVLDYLKFFLLCSSFAMLSFSFAVLAQSFFPFPWWRLWVTLVLLIVVLLSEFAYVMFFSNTKVVALLMTSWGFLAVVVTWLVIGCLMIMYSSHRIEKFHRLALRKF